MNWLENRNLSNFLDLSIREYLDQHQLSTKNILKDVGFSDEVIIYASSHHLNYFSDFDQNKLPVECNIIEIADKFNAISQSEGIRIYAQRKSHSEAMEIIIKGFKGVFDASSQEDCFKVEILKILSNKYLYNDFNSLKIKIEKFNLNWIILRIMEFLF